MQVKKIILLIILTYLAAGCATYTAQYRNRKNNILPLPEKKMDARFYLIGDAGYSVMDTISVGLQVLSQLIQKENNKNDYLVFLGDNVYPAGIPDKNDENYELTIHRLNVQIEIGKKFKGKTWFIPGNHDWYADDPLEGLHRQEKLVNEALGEESFLPEESCPFYETDINNDFKLIIIDTQWYLENWDRLPSINDDCEIKTRERFFLEIQSELKKGANQTVLFLMHHPMFTNGIHGGRYAINKHLYPLSENKKIPLPGIGTLVAEIRTQGGVSIQDRYNERYNNLMKRLETIAASYNNIIFVSGHEHNLQYLKQDSIKQIVSGSGSKTSYAALRHNGIFTYGKQGLATLQVYKDKSVWLSFYGWENNKPRLLFQNEIKKPDVLEFNVDSLPESFPQFVETSIYPEDETEVSDFYEMIWGENYRKLYGTKIKARVATLDTLYGGVEIVHPGGGHQTRSLRLKRKDGRELNMRALKKSPSQLLQSTVFKKEYIKDDFQKTAVEDLIFDFFTAAHPYAFMAVPDLARAANVYSTNPRLYYIPKHKYMGDYNQEFGNELYMIVERPEENYSETKTFGYADDIESTYDIIEKLKEDEKYKIDEPAYIRARLFDMLIGDWDRHQDQWRWAQFDQPNGDKLYRPIPRDRDQAFSNFDGNLLDLMRTISGSTNQYQVYDDKLEDVKWINKAGVKLDRTLIQQSSKEEWLKQAKFLQEHITDEVVEKAFRNIPEEAHGEALNKLKAKLKGRRSNLTDIAERYFDFLNKLVILTGTYKDDFIKVERRGDKITNVKIWRIIDGEKEKIMVDRDFNSDITNEIWIYGLDDKDVFEVTGNGENLIYVRLIGGLENDTYKISNGNKVKIYDHKSQESTIKENHGANVKLTDIYDYNVFQYDKIMSHKSTISPLGGYNPDDGSTLGISYTSTEKGFEQNPFTNQHRIKAAYYSETHGFEMFYNGEFANFRGKWNYNLSARFTSNNYTHNFFGYGNETSNKADDFDFHRVKLSIYNMNFGIAKHSEFGSDYLVHAVLESYEVQNTTDRFINGYFPESYYETLLKRSYFTGLNGRYDYLSIDDEETPTHGMNFMLDMGATAELGSMDENLFGYINSKLGFYNALSLNRKWVLRTNFYSQWRIGNGYRFYQAASAGGDNGLRGYRHNRFTGKSAFITSADLRYTLPLFKIRLFPLQPGVFIGYDVGRVWVKNEDSKLWHDDYGGGFWITAVERLTGTFNVFRSKEGYRFTFKAGFSF